MSYDRLGTRDVLEKVVRADIEKLRMSLEELSRELLPLGESRHPALDRA